VHAASDRIQISLAGIPDSIFIISRLTRYAGFSLTIEAVFKWQDVPHTGALINNMAL